MKNITDYFGTPEQESLSKRSEKILTERLSSSPSCYKANFKDKKKKKIKRKNGSKIPISSTNTEVGSVSVHEKQEVFGKCDDNLTPDSITLSCTTSASSNDEVSLDQSNMSSSIDKKNAFQVMMDSRNKSIGSNSPGKEISALEIPQEDAKVKILVARRKLLTNWAASKGASKRKREEEDRDQIIKVKLEKRSKRMKKLLNCSSNFDISSKECLDTKKTFKKKRKRVKKLSCSSNSTDDFTVEQLDKHTFEISSSSKTQNSTNLSSQKIKKINDKIRMDKKLLQKENIVDRKDRKKNSTEDFVSERLNKQNCKVVPKKKETQTEEVNIIEDSSQEGTYTSTALRSWRMRIRLNLGENESVLNEQSSTKQNSILLDSNENSNGNFFLTNAKIKISNYIT